MDNKYIEFVDLYAGNPGIVSASGWSLRNIPDVFLSKYPVFAVNTAYKYFEERGIKRPEYLVSIDGAFPHNNQEVYGKFGNDFLWFRHPYIVNRTKWHSIKGYSLEDTQGCIIADGSSTHAALHLALIAECNPIYLCGADMSFSPNGEVYATREQDRLNKQWRKDCWGCMNDGYDFISKLVKPGRILDCSPDGELKIFPKVAI